MGSRPITAQVANEAQISWGKSRAQQLKPILN